MEFITIVSVRRVSHLQLTLHGSLNFLYKDFSKNVKFWNLPKVSWHFLKKYLRKNLIFCEVWSVSKKIILTFAKIITRENFHFIPCRENINTRKFSLPLDSQKFKYAKILSFSFAKIYTTKVYNLFLSDCKTWKRLSQNLEQQKL